MKPTELDPETCAFFLEVPGARVVNLQAYFELYEGVGTVRTLDVRRSLVCVLTTTSMCSACIEVLEAIRADVGWRQVELPADVPLDKILGYFREGNHAQNDP